MKVERGNSGGRRVKAASDWWGLENEGQEDGNQNEVYKKNIIRNLGSCDTSKR